MDKYQKLVAAAKWLLEDERCSFYRGGETYADVQGQQLCGHCRLAEALDLIENMISTDNLFIIS